MAEHGAHITATEQTQPSIFEVVASDSLNSSFNPAIKRLCNLLASINPEKFSWTIRFYDEIFLLINGCIQQYYVREYGGSLSEVFYGLTRTHWYTDKLSNKTRFMIFGAIVILPYIRLKIENLLQKYRDEIEISHQPLTIKHRNIKLAANKVYKIVTAIYETFQIYQYIVYMANLSKSHSLLLRLMRHNLTYMPPDDNQEWTWTDLIKGKIKNSTIITSAVFRGLELSAFFLQFIQWWQNEANQGPLTNLPIPPPPQLDANSNKYLGVCPICLQSWQIPTAISISGYVYCYKCIVKHFERSQTCPVTNYPASIDDLLRIYEN